MQLDAGLLDNITHQFLEALKKDGAIVSKAGMQLFTLLATLQLVLSCIWRVLDGESLEKTFTFLVQFSFTLGFFYYCVNHGGELMMSIINGFIELGQKSGVLSIDPSSILSQGLSIANNILNAFANWGLLLHPFISFVGAGICFVVVVLYALIATELTLVLIQSYFLVMLSGLFFAFAGNDFTQPMMVQYVKSIIGIGLKIMALYFVIGVGQSLGDTWAEMVTLAATNHDLTPMFAILAAVIVFYLIVKNIPSFVAQLSGVGGFQYQGDAAVVMAINGGLNAGNLLKNAAQSGFQAGRAGGQLLKSAKQDGLLSTMKHATGAALSSARDVMNGDQAHKSMGHKFNRHMANKVSRSAYKNKLKASKAEAKPSETKAPETKAPETKPENTNEEVKNENK